MLVHVDDLQDPRLQPFRGLRFANWTVGSGWFIAEGPRLVERLLCSDYAIHSLLVSTKYVKQWSSRVPPETLALVVPDALVTELVGFNFHRGVMACGLRKPALTVRATLARPLTHDATLVAVHGVQDPENLGGILRSCAALGIEHILVGPRCADPLCRRVLRVSMGTALSLQLLQSADLIGDLSWLRQQHGAHSVATTLAADSEPLETAARSGPLVILLGNEAYGLPVELQEFADRRVRIDMRLGTDSLNVSVAAGIVLHYFCRIAHRSGASPK